MTTRRRYRRIDPETLQELAQRPRAAAALITDEVRLPLAGGPRQDPDPPVRGRLDEASLASGSLHPLAQVPHPGPRSIGAQRIFCLELARAVGLSVAEAELHRSKQGTHLLIMERYDREVAALSPAPPADRKTVELPWIKRLDQTTASRGLRPGAEPRPPRKISIRGRPCFADCIALLRSSAQRPVQEMKPLLRWLIFRLIIGNRDNHTKNLARVYCQGYWKPAPFYDLVCTGAYKAPGPEPGHAHRGRTRGQSYW